MPEAANLCAGWLLRRAKRRRRDLPALRPGRRCRDPLRPTKPRPGRPGRRPPTGDLPRPGHPARRLPLPAQAARPATTQGGSMRPPEPVNIRRHHDELRGPASGPAAAATFLLYLLGLIAVTAAIPVEIILWRRALWPGAEWHRRKKGASQKR